ncbi:diguanylate cyclase/phosphodiesterase [Rhizobium sp. PDO1-076]|uniref:putative bifunctional diguanylate cyclase/phosphodiesterase n=1 Tax=Rhizobium sp. PDO1-076 TaxID=1125979 RepID=UPI00024E220E|nr:EAL domain-containing protein [Rhizobium sp. PDO1-076]EHS50631.1 diguanylate cyclase/phosphodiesterase [Rhizobium sp. PDO1-076]
MDQSLTASPLSARPDDKHVTHYARQRFHRGVAEAFAPIIRGFLLPAIVYYTLITVAHFFAETGTEQIILTGMSLATVLLALFLLRSLKGDLGYGKLELISLSMHLAMYVNIVTYLSIHFEEHKLVYFVLLILVISTSAVSARVIIVGSALSLTTMLWLAQKAGAEVFLQYAFIGLAGAFAALGMAWLMRTAILKAVAARTMADDLRRKAEILADFDSLTGLPSRRSFFIELDRALTKSTATTSGFYMGIIDLDGFKPVNDLYGHVTGDRLLTEVAERLRAALSNDCFIARLGGDEFALIVPDVSGQSEVQALGERLCNGMRDPFVLDSLSISISASAGFAHCPTHGSTANQLYERADHALYSAKRATRGDVVIFSASHEAAMKDVGRIDQTLRNCNLNKEMSLVYQPQIDINTGRTIGFEALARWNSPTLGPVSPSTFIPAAERSGLIERMTSVLLHKALSTAATWPHNVKLSFNLSAIDLMSPRSISNVVHIVRDSNIEPNRVIFEITETAVMADFDRARDSLELLAGMGCLIALDDFGSGYSNFGYINRFPLHKLKTDRNFVLRLREDDGVGGNILRAIADLSSSLGIECLAEGVESDFDLEAVRAAGIHQVQGFYFGRPMAGLDAMNYLQAESHRLAS